MKGASKRGGGSFLYFRTSTRVKNQMRLEDSG